MSRHDQLKTIIDGLSLKYQVLALIIQYHDEPCEIIVVETMLLSHKARLDRNNSNSSLKLLSMNLTQGNLTPPAHSTIPNITNSTLPLSSHESQPQFNVTRNNRGERSFNYIVGGHNGGRSCIQYQICSKIVHDARVCYYRLLVKPLSFKQWCSPVIPL